jgi:hypothetical protein
MAKDNGNEKATLPYGSWKTVRAFLGKLKQTTIPPRIDNSVMVGMSGSGKSEMRTALRYLGLIDSADTVTPKLKQIVTAYGTETWSQELGDLIWAAYTDVVGQDAEWLDNGTASLLREKFKAASGMDGEMLDRTTRFFLSALDDSGTTYSPYFKVRGARAASTRRTPSKKQGGKSSPNEQGPRGPIPPDGTVALPFSFPGKMSAAVHIANDMTEAEWSMVDAYVRSYLKLHGGKK